MLTSVLVINPSILNVSICVLFQDRIGYPWLCTAPVSEVYAENCEPLMVRSSHFLEHEISENVE